MTSGRLFPRSRRVNTPEAADFRGFTAVFFPQRDMRADADAVRVVAHDAPSVWRDRAVQQSASCARCDGARRAYRGVRPSCQAVTRNSSSPTWNNAAPVIGTTWPAISTAADAPSASASK